MSRISRSDDRRDFDQPVRVRLLERDVDTLEEALGGLRDELKAMRTVLVGILISLATAAVLLAINMGIGSIGHP